MRKRLLAHALAVMLGPLIAGCSPPSPVARAPGTVVTPAPRPTLDGRALARLQLGRYAVNALYIAITDDDNPPNWKDPEFHANCGPDTRVFVDDEPLVAGQRVPGPVFTLRWEMDGCWPFGEVGPLLAGRYELLVMHDDEQGPEVVLLGHDELMLADRSMPRS
jgi:hypothetical protein